MVARSSRLKVFRVPIGFHDAYVAAPNQKAAIEAWGSDRDVFARGEAELVTDPKLTAEPLARPGEVVKRLRGTAAEQLAALPPNKAAAPRAKEARAAIIGRGKKEARPEPQGRRAKPARKVAPRPSRAALDRAEVALAQAGDERERALKRLIHAAALKPWGDWLPWAWPHDGLQHDKGSGEALAEQYRRQGLALLPVRATFENGGNGLEAGVSEMLDRMQTGRWKVFAHLEDWLAEFRLYHRKDGLIVKLCDDRISAARYAMMMKRYAVRKPKPRAPRSPGQGGAGGWMG